MGDAVGPGVVVGKGLGAGDSEGGAVRRLGAMGAGLGASVGEDVTIPQSHSFRKNAMVGQAFGSTKPLRPLCWTSSQERGAWPRNET